MVVSGLLSKAIASQADPLVNEHIKSDNFFKRYLTSTGNSAPWSPVSLNIYALLMAQLSKMQETEADTEAVTVAGLNPEHGISLFKAMHNPNTENWPLYAKIQNILSNRMLMPIISLPILKQHVPHLPSVHDRVAHLASLKATWEEKQLEKKAANA